MSRETDGEVNERLGSTFGERVCALYDYLENTGVDPEEAYWMMDCAMTLLVKNDLVNPQQEDLASETMH